MKTSFVFMPVAGDPRQKWMAWISRAAWVTCGLGATLPFHLHIAFLPLALLSLLLFQWQLRWSLAIDRVVAAQELEARRRGGIPIWAEVYLMMQDERAKNEGS